MYISSKENPYHLSIGAVLMNDKGRVACHYFKSYHTKKNDIKEIYILMRESMESDEKITDCLHRGLNEEFGAEAQIERFLGSIVSHFTPSHQVQVEKTTLYFLASLKTMDINQRLQEDPESHSEIVWKKPAFLIAKMKDQARRYPERTDIDESKILERLNYYFQ